MTLSPGEIVLTEEPLCILREWWRARAHDLRWNCLFVIPAWLEAWWEGFGNRESRPLLWAARERDRVIGVAPLMVQDRTAAFLGGTDVCDYQDFITSAGRESLFFRGLLRGLSADGIHRIILECVRPDAAAMIHFIPEAQKTGFSVHVTEAGAVYELSLPDSWERYLNENLNGKQRHEVRRKMKRLHESGDIRFSVSRIPQDALETFLDLFSKNRPDKSAFMTETMVRYFRNLAERTSEDSLLKLGVLSIDGIPAASVMCFDDGETVYLYNNGYDRRYETLSVGVMAKLFSLKNGIMEGRKRYSFLKGHEPYKQRLGGNPMPLYRIEIDLI